MRPRTLEDVVGQEDIIGRGKLLYRAIQADRLSSIVLYGPPGVGKTTLAKVIANTTKADFRQVNATIAGKKDMEEVVAAAKMNLGQYGRKTILFIDEIHRFNKAQQDYLLPFVEDGTVILIGATTENPYYEVTLQTKQRISSLRSLMETPEQHLTLSNSPCSQLIHQRTEKYTSHWKSLKNVSRNVSLNTTRTAIIITTPLQHSSSRSAALILMLLCIIWQGCLMQERTLNSSPGV